MDSSPLPEQHSFAGGSEDPSLLFLLKRGLDYLQRGHDAEGVAIFALAREQFSPDQIHLADALDTFLQGYAGYQHVQQAFQEASLDFARAHAEQQARMAAFGKTLSTLIGGIGTPHQSSEPLTDALDHQLPPYLSPQDPQKSPSEVLPESSIKDSRALPALSFTCFGHFEVRRLNQTVVLCSNRSGQAILRYLIAQPGHCATADTLMVIFWPEDEAEAIQSKLHIAISALRRSLNHGYSCEPGCGYILCKNRVYQLNPKVVIQTDVDEFLQCYQRGQQRSERRVALYERACRLYTGPFLSEDVYADWSFLQREQLSQTYLAMCRDLADYYFNVKRYDDATKWATAMLKENRCDETAHRYFIQIYAAQGLRSEALQQYQRCERILREELGLQPLPETTHVLQMMLASELSPFMKQKYSESTAKI